MEQSFQFAYAKLITFYVLLEKDLRKIESNYLRYVSVIIIRHTL